MFKFFHQNTTAYSLAELDNLFEGTISKLPVDAQIGYCQRTIERCKFDLGQPCEKKKMKYLVNTVTAAEDELRKLGK